MDFIQDKIDYAKEQITLLQTEITELEELKKRGTTGMEKWLDFPFESSSGLTEEFAQFAKDFKKELVKRVSMEWELVNWSRGHFEVSGFLKNKTTGKYIYFSTSDVRHFPNSWYNDILIRTAEHDKDYTGGSNRSTSWISLPENLKRL